MNMEPSWLTLGRRLAALAQCGLAYSRDQFDIERYHELQRIAADIMSSGSEDDPETILGLFRNERGYATPKLDVRAVVFHDDRVLLVRERSDGGWTLPGGWIDVGDSPSEAASREVFEESGYVVKPFRLLALYDRSRHPHPPLPPHIYKVFIQCELLGGAPATSIETDGVGFFEEHNLPELSVTRVTLSQIKRMFQLHGDPLAPADFD